MGVMAGMGEMVRAGEMVGAEEKMVCLGLEEGGMERDDGVMRAVGVYIHTSAKHPPPPARHVISEWSRQYHRPRTSIMTTPPSPIGRRHARRRNQTARDGLGAPRTPRSKVLMNPVDLASRVVVEFCWTRAGTPGPVRWMHGCGVECQAGE
jgi:hypothetical protein